MIFERKKSNNLLLLPPKGFDFKDPDFVEHLFRARIELAELKGYDSFPTVNPWLLVSPIILRESIASSGVENIHTTFVDVLQNQLFPEREQGEDDKEVLRYEKAITRGYKLVSRYGLSTRLISEITKILVPKTGGEYRKQQNAIANSKTEEILYTPPAAHEMSHLMQNWEDFVNKTHDIDPLIKTAIAHYQFEAIHPFDDGNGRVGRILIVLSLVNEQIIKHPILFISGYILQNKSEYYSLLRGVTEEGKWKEFIIFMLKGFYSQTIETKNTLTEINKTYMKIRRKIRKSHRKIYSADLVDRIFSGPVITPVKLSREMKIHYTTATRYLEELRESGILTDKKVGRYHMYFNKELLKIMASQNH